MMTFEMMMQLTAFGLFLGGFARIGWESAGAICWLITKLSFTAIARWKSRKWEREE